MVSKKVSSKKVSSKKVSSKKVSSKKESNFSFLFKNDLKSVGKRFILGSTVGVIGSGLYHLKALNDRKNAQIKDIIMVFCEYLKQCDNDKYKELFKKATNKQMLDLYNLISPDLIIIDNEYRTNKDITKTKLDSLQKIIKRIDIWKGEEKL
jgi:hypothetical protein